MRRRLARRFARRLGLVGVLLAPPVAAATQYPPVVTRSRLDPSREVNFHAVLLPDTVYVGQQATYQIGVFLNQEVRRRLRRNPEFVPPETRSLLVYDLPDAKAPLVGTIDGRTYEVHVFQRAFFALSPGRYAVPPSRLSYAVPQSASFFSREETHSMRSEALSLVVLPVPSAGRPDDWAGAVGDWRARLRVDSSSGRAGDPLVVTMRIEGRGNVTLLPRPRLAVAWGSVVAADERVDLDSTPSTLRGAKEFDWLLTPREAGRRAIPAQRFVFFNPGTRRYEVTWSPAIPVAVADGDAVAIDSLADAAMPAHDARPDTLALSVRPSMGAAVRFGPLRSPWFLALLALAPLPAAVGAFRHRRRRPHRAPSGAHRLREVLAGPPPDAAVLRQLVHAALRERLALDVGLSLANESLVADLRHEGVTPATAAHADALLRSLDAVVFGGRPRSPTPTPTAVSTLVDAVHAEARGSSARSHGRRARRATRALGLLVFVSLGAPPLLARQGDEAERSWALAHTAYAGRDFERAERHFLDAARLRPDFPNVWANVGTSAFMAADTAHAVQGWQRALRREPLAPELRSRLALVRAVQERGVARLPAIPTLLPPVLLLVLWGAGWWALARRAWAGRRIGRRAAWLTGAAALVWAGAAVFDARQRAVHLAVVVRPEPLRALPVLGADQGPAPLSGEVAEVLEHRGAWARVRLDGQRDGWIASELLLPLGGD